MIYKKGDLLVWTGIPDPRWDKQDAKTVREILFPGTPYKVTNIIPRGNECFYLLNDHFYIESRFLYPPPDNEPL